MMRLRGDVGSVNAGRRPRRVACDCARKQVALMAQPNYSPSRLITSRNWFGPLGIEVRLARGKQKGKRLAQQKLHRQQSIADDCWYARHFRNR